MLLEPGYYKDLSAKDYHASHSISSSALVHALRSPAHFWANYIGNPKCVAKQDKPALHFGRAAHVYLLERDTFPLQYAVTPKLDRRTTAGKQLHASFEETCAENGTEIITEDDLATIKGMAEALEQFEIEEGVSGAVIPLAQVFAKGRAEESFVWTDPESGLLLRARTDWRIGNVVVDYKTARDARPQPFRREVAHRRYYMRAAMYLDGIEAVTGTRPSAFFLVAQEKEAPYAAAAYQINPDNLEFGRQQYKAALMSIRRCLDAGRWDGYSRQVQVITVPDYLYEETVQ